MATGIRATLEELIALRGKAGGLAAPARRRSREPMAGLRHSAFRGRGLEYAESRLYTPGDDVRHLDWRVTARTGRAHTKIFQAERDRCTAILVDRSPAMYFGTRVCFKSTGAARIGALLAWAAAAQGDRLAAVASGEIVPPRGGRRGVLRVLDALARWTEPCESVADWPAVLASAVRVLRPGSHVLALGDARSFHESCRQPLRELARHHDVVVGIVCDALERSAPPRGDYLVDAGRQITRIALDSDNARQAWLAPLIRQREAALACCAEAGIRAHEIFTDQDPLTALNALLRTSAVVNRAA